MSKYFLFCRYAEMVFCYQNCSDLLWEKNVLVIEKNFWFAKFLRSLKVSKSRNDFFKYTFPPKNKRTNFTLLLWNLRSTCFRSFLEEIEDTKKTFRNYLTFRTIFSNSDRSEQFLVTECFFNLFLEVSHI
jgi:hypothetical protein